MKGYRKVLIAIDGSLDVLNHGIKLAQDEKTWITVIKVIPPYDGDLNLTGIKNISDILDSGARQVISGIKSVAGSEGALIKARLEEGEVHQKIVEVAQEEQCDLIILGAKKKRNFFERMFGDHVMEKVIGHAPCPVLVVQ